MKSFLIEDVVCEKATEKAILVSGPFFDEDTWVPQSQVHDDSEVWGEDDEGDLYVTRWFAEKSGWV